MARFILSAFADEAANDLEGQIAALKRCGIDYIEPRNIDGKSVSYMSEEELRAVRARLDEAGIRVSSLGSPIGKYAIEKPFEEHLEQTRLALRAAEILGTGNIRMFSFFVKQEELSLHRDEVLRRLGIMLEEAKAKGIRLCHENESEIYGQMPAQVRDLLTSLPDLFGIHDPANYRMNGADVLEGIRATLPSLAYMHIKDAIYEEQAIVPAGEGEGKIGEALSLIDAHTDGEIFLTVEPHLKSFDAYASVDKHQLKGKHFFTNNNESFDFAVKSLEKVLQNEGFAKDEQNRWIR